jgi:hypothetical protein
VRYAECGKVKQLGKQGFCLFALFLWASQKGPLNYKEE